MDLQIFQYGREEIDFLKARDERLAKVIERYGKIERRVNPDLFSALVDIIVGQQISTKAHRTIRGRFLTEFGAITPERMAHSSVEQIQKMGISFRKAGNIKKLTDKVVNRELDLEQLHHLSDEEVLTALTGLDGIGIWSAEMLMLFSMQRPNILSYGDLGIHRGLQRIYEVPKVSKQEFMQYHERYTPYASVASFYLWAVASEQT